MSQLLLVTSGGDAAIITLECAKCVPPLRLTDRTVTDDEYADHRLTFVCAVGETETHSFASADAIRVSVRHAIDRCKAGTGEIIDIFPKRHPRKGVAHPLDRRPRPRETGRLAYDRRQGS